MDICIYTRCGLACIRRHADSQDAHPCEAASDLGISRMYVHTHTHTHTHSGSRQGGTLTYVSLFQRDA